MRTIDRSRQRRWDDVHLVTISTRMPRDEVEKVVEMCKSRGVSVYTWLLLLARKDLESWKEQTVHGVSREETKRSHKRDRKGGEAPKVKRYHKRDR